MKHFSAINRAIEHTGLKLRAGRGYYYFVTIANGDQVGESIYVYRCDQLPVEFWAEQAEARATAPGERVLEYLRDCDRRNYTPGITAADNAALLLYVDLLKHSLSKAHDELMTRD